MRAFLLTRLVAAGAIVVSCAAGTAAFTPAAIAQTAVADVIVPPAPKPAVPKPTPAKQLFGSKDRPADLKPRAIGFYSRGCLAGGQALPIDGPAWQAMRLSRNRNWGHPNLIKLIERLATDAKREDDWPGLLVGDLTQPRGGPMLSGHASHQIGLDADIWLTPMPDRRLSWAERETTSAVSMLADTLSVDPKVFTTKHVKLIQRAASYPEVERIGVNPAIKLALCRAEGGDKPWLQKIQGWPGHHYHMHIRIKCPENSDGCTGQGPPTHTSCAHAEKWYRDTKAWLEQPKKPKSKTEAKKPSKPKPEVTLTDLPNACEDVLAAASAGSPKNQIEHVLAPARKPVSRAAAVSPTR
ncbi:penicillin-insensitive murein endopeptidase [Filomicrobium insigne]|uniref:Penicillin-insensitive murein endopeptidase n=1 Tax=Filomicrobium insigne TaxID=418854 RepID=A0A1H0HAD1_9HYPH|nr:penicillin-insensitive murein endopeptidase [Filomicrobium insigne]SDO15851.1 penicillin-insensitive murein endopeptidase [Filomicrobium insigne]